MQGILFLIFIAVVTVFFISKSDKESRANKIIFSVVIFCIILFAFVYESFSSNEVTKNREVLNHFNQSKDIICNAHTVNNKNFLYFSGTQSFSGKPEKDDFSGYVFDIEDCDIK